MKPAPARRVDASRAILESGGERKGFGLLVAAIGTAGFASALHLGVARWIVLAWTTVLGIGQAMGFAQPSGAAGGGVPADQRGAASALMSKIQEVGTALGLAVLVGLATSTTAASGPSGLEATAAGLLRMASSFGARMPVARAAIGLLVIPGKPKRV